MSCRDFEIQKYRPAVVGQTQPELSTIRASDGKASLTPLLFFDNLHTGVRHTCRGLKINVNGQCQDETFISFIAVNILKEFFDVHGVSRRCVGE